MKTDVFIYLYAVSRTKWKIGISKATLSAFLRLRKHYMSHLCNFKFSGSHTKKDIDEVNFNNCILPNVSKIVSLFLHAFFFFCTVSQNQMCLLTAHFNSDLPHFMFKSHLWQVVATLDSAGLEQLKTSESPRDTLSTTAI